MVWPFAAGGVVRIYALPVRGGLAGGESLDFIGMSNMKTRHIVIAASARKAGKTLLAQALIETATGAGLDCCFVKLRRRPGRELEAIPGRGPEGSDTSRCAGAGASRQLLVEYGGVDDLALYEPDPPISSDLAVWETNSGIRFVNPDAVVFLDMDCGPGKNPEIALTANIVVPAPVSPSRAAELCPLILQSSGFPGFTPFMPGFKCWLETPRGNVLGAGIARLLRSIGQTGSISSGSLIAGISYRRAWTLLSIAEENLGARLINRKRGGSLNGGSSLTKLAERLLDDYSALEGVLSAAVRNGEEM